MKERIDVEKRYTFLYPDGSEWFDITDSVKRYEIYRIRDKWGGNKGIHKTYMNEQTNIQEV
jgi:hypothetical protein